MADGTVIALLITTSLGIAVYLAKHVKKSECWSKEKCIECDFRGSSQPNTPTRGLTSIEGSGVINNQPKEGVKPLNKEVENVVETGV